MAIPEEIEKLVGKQLGEPTVMGIERGSVKRFAEAIDDPNPLYCDAEYAKKSRYGEIIAPPGFFGWPVKGGGFFTAVGEIIGPFISAGYPGLLDGGVEFEFYHPIRAGDTLVSLTRIASITEKVSKAGKSMLFTILESTFLNQNGDKAAVRRNTLILRRL